MTDERAAVEFDMKIRAFDNQRLFDLVRFCRHELHDEGLITDGEIAWLIEQGSSSARRLEDYDALRSENERMDETNRRLAANNDALSARVSELTRLLAEAEERVKNLRGGYHDIMSAEYLCSDTFAWACADVEDIGGDCEEWRELAELIERFGSIAVTAYIAIKRGQDPVTGTQNDDRFIRAKAELLDRLSRSEETAEFSGLYDHVQLRALQSGEGGKG